MRRTGGVLLVALAVLLAGGLVAAYGALGGVDRLRAQAAPTASCSGAPVTAQGDAAEAEASRVVLLALGDAACRLHVGREDLVLALGRGQGMADAARMLGVAPQALSKAVTGSIAAAADAEERAGRITPDTALALRTLVAVIPPDRLLSAVRGEQGACAEVPWKQVASLREVAAEVGILTGLRAACALGVAPVDAVAALADPAGLGGLAQRAGRPPAEVESAVRKAMVASIGQARDAGALSGTEATVLGAAAEVAPVDRILAIVRGDDDPCAPYAWSPTQTQSQVLAQVALIGAVDAACKLHAPTFDVFAALASPAALTALEQETGASQDQVDAALKDGFDRGIAAATDAGAMSGIEALLLRAALSQVGVLDLLGRLSG